MSSTEHRAPCITAFATLPNNKCFNVVPPGQPITIKSASHSSAALTIDSVTIPLRKRRLPSKTDSPKFLSSRVQRRLRLAYFFHRCIKGNHSQHFHFGILGSALADHGVQGRFREYGAIECKQNSTC